MDWSELNRKLQNNHNPNRPNSQSRTSNHSNHSQIKNSTFFQPIPSNESANTYQPHYRLSFLLNVDDLENSLKFAPDLKLVRLLSFKYRQQLFRKRKWASILTTLLSVYGLLVAFILAEIEIRCLEGESGSLEQQYDCSVKEIPGVDSTLTNTSLLEYKKFCSAGDSAAKREILINYCSAYKVVDKLQNVLKILLHYKFFY